MGLKNILQQGISKPVFYFDLVYHFKRIVGKPDFSDQLKNIIKRYAKVGYNMDIMQHPACLVIHPITVYSYGFLFSFLRLSDGPGVKLISVDWCMTRLFLLGPPQLNLRISLSRTICES